MIFIRGKTFLLLFQVSRLIYTNSGLAVLALAANAVHKLWKWQRNDRNVTGKVEFQAYMVAFPFQIVTVQKIFVNKKIPSTGHCKCYATTMATNKWNFDDQ